MAPCPLSPEVCGDDARKAAALEEAPGEEAAAAAHVHQLLPVRRGQIVHGQLKLLVGAREACSRHRAMQSATNEQAAAERRCRRRRRRPDHGGCATPCSQPARTCPHKALAPAALVDEADERRLEDGDAAPVSLLVSFLLHTARQRQVGKRVARLKRACAARAVQVARRPPAHALQAQLGGVADGAGEVKGGRSSAAAAGGGGGGRSAAARACRCRIAACICHSRCPDADGQPAGALGGRGASQEELCVGDGCGGATCLRWRPFRAFMTLPAIRRTCERAGPHRSEPQHVCSWAPVAVRSLPRSPWRGEMWGMLRVELLQRNRVQIGRAQQNFGCCAASRWRQQ